MTQGHRYRLPDGRQGLEVGFEPTSPRVSHVAVLVEGWPYPAPPVRVMTHALTPLPMVYFHGETPKEPK